MGGVMAEHDLLADRLVGYATSALLRDLPQMRRDLVEASEWLTAYAALFDAWKAVFGDYETDADLREQFAELLATAPRIKTRRHRLNAVSNDREGSPPEDQP
jgi:hypothetical protein